MAPMTRRGRVLIEALSLPVRERAKLAVELIASMDAPPDGDVETAWAEEIQTRVKRIRAGESKTVKWEDLRKRLLAPKPSR